MTRSNRLYWQLISCSTDSRDLGDVALLDNEQRDRRAELLAEQDDAELFSRWIEKMGYKNRLGKHKPGEYPLHVEFAAWKLAGCPLLEKKVVRKKTSKK